MTNVPLRLESFHLTAAGPKLQQLAACEQKMLARPPPELTRNGVNCRHGVGFRETKTPPVTTTGGVLLRREP
jgi:hypothetical protein